MSQLKDYLFYEDQWAKIFCGDCLEIMPLIENKFDGLITDPPFAFGGGLSTGMSSNTDDQFFSHWWKSICICLEKILLPHSEGFIWCDWKTVSIIAEGFKTDEQTYNFWKVTQVLHHYREMIGQGKPFRNSVDLIAYVRGPKSDGHRISNSTANWISKYWYYGKHNNHPAEKDPAICEQLVEWCSDQNQAIIDPFMGSGPVLLSSKKLGRKYIGIEINPKYCEIAVKRLRQEVFDFRQGDPK